MFNDEPKVPKVRMRSSSRGGDGECDITIGGLTKRELELVESMLAGVRWGRVRDGRLQTTRRYKRPPTPVTDPVIEPHWPVSVGSAVQMRMFETSAKHHLTFTASISIQHLCGYDYSVGNYKREALKLKRLGFSCLRSRRGREGKFWEIWFLPYLEAAKGGLEPIVKNVSPKDFNKKLDNVIQYLARNCSFGSCDVSVQRLAMVID